MFHLFVSPVVAEPVSYPCVRWHHSLTRVVHFSPDLRLYVYKDGSVFVCTTPHNDLVDHFKAENQIPCDEVTITFTNVKKVDERIKVEVVESVKVNWHDFEIPTSEGVSIVGTRIQAGPTQLGLQIRCLNGMTGMAAINLEEAKSLQSKLSRYINDQLAYQRAF